MSAATRNPYRVPQGYVLNPFDPLYQQPDEELCREPSAQAILDYAIELEDQIPGDFELSEVISEIKNNTLSFVRTGLLAFKVKVLKLYREGYRTFKDFCEQVLGVTHWQINRTIEAARVVIELAQDGFDILPKNEAQARPLTKFTGADLLINWQTIVDTIPEYKITSSTINEVLGVETTTLSLRLRKELYKRIKARALELGVSVEELLESFLGDEVTPASEEQIAAWEEDLERLTNEESEPIGTVSTPKSEPIGTITPDETLTEESVETDLAAKDSEDEKPKSVPIGKVSTEPTLTEEGDRPLWMEETNGVTQKSSSSTSVVTERGSKASSEQGQNTTKPPKIKGFLDFTKPSGKKKRPRGFGR